VPSEKTPTPDPFLPSDPPLVRKKGDREPPRDPSVDPSPAPIVNATPRGGDGENS
jgi:hypothetical protein